MGRKDRKGRIDQIIKKIRAALHLRESQPHSKTECLGPSPEDPSPTPILDNQNSTRTDGRPSKTVQQQSCQAPPDPGTNTTSQACLEQPSHHLGEQDKQSPPFLIIGTLWKEAAKSLDNGVRDKLDRIIKSKREGEAADPPEDHGGSSPPSGCGDEPPAAVSSVLSEADKCKKKDEKATWKPVSLDSPRICTEHMFNTDSRLSIKSSMGS